MARKFLGWASSLGTSRQARLLASLFLLPGSFSFVATAAAQDTRSAGSARAYVADLKRQLKSAEQQYSGVLADNVSGVERSAIDHVEQLRGDLKISVVRWLSQSSNSEVSLAVNRAAVDSILDTVHAYEQAVGIGQGRATSEWSVFSVNELKEILGQVERKYVEIRQASVGISDAELPAQQLLRLSEQKSWMDSLRAELQVRNSSGLVGGRAIDARITVNEARARFPRIRDLDGVEATKHFNKRLLFQIEARLHWNTQDASLKGLRESLPELPSIAPRTNATRGPPPSSWAEPVKDVVDELKDAAFEELSATTQRDLPGLAEAHSKLRAYAEWLSASTGHNFNDSRHLSLLTDDDILILSRKYQEWVVRLAFESQHINDSPQLGVEQEQARERMRETEAEIQRRLFASEADTATRPTVTSLTKAYTARSKLPEVRAVDECFEARRLQFNVVELKSLMDRYGAAFKPQIEPVYRQAVLESLNKRANLLSRAWDDLQTAETDVLVNGRGKQGVDVGRQLFQADRSISSAASALRKIITSPEFTHTYTPDELATVTRGIQSIPSGDGATEFEDAVRATIKINSNPWRQNTSDVTVSSQSSDFAGLGAEKSTVFKIKLSGPGENVGLPVGRPLADYRSLFPDSELWTKQHPQIRNLKDAIRAPGGVVIDATFPDDDAFRITEAHLDPDSGVIKLLIEGKWRTLNASHSLSLERAAWAFARDQRIAAVDLRNLDTSEVQFLSSKLVSLESMGPQAKLESQAALLSLTSVNLHPAFVNTPIGQSLILADQLIFEILPEKEIWQQGQDTKYGFNLLPLRQALQLDSREMLVNESSWKSLFQKSLLSVSKVSVILKEDSVSVDPTLEFTIYRLPPADDGTPPIFLAHSSEWFEMHESALKQLPVLSQLTQVGSLVATMRTILRRQIPNNLNDLMLVEAPDVATPRLLCRPGRQGACGLSHLWTTYSRRTETKK